MKNSILWALVALNGVLLSVLAFRATSENQAIAAQAGRPNDYLLISGDIPGGPSSLVFVLDTTNAVLGGMAFTQQGAKGKLDTMPPIDLSRHFEEPEAPVKKGR